MKTKIRTFIAVCVLAFAETNANATVNYINLNNRVVFEEEKNTKSLKAEENLTTENEKTGTNENEASGYFGDVTDFQKEAEIIIKNIADMQEAKMIQMLLNKSIGNFESENSNDISAERAEAQLVTKLVADQEEAKAVQKLVTEGRL